MKKLIVMLVSMLAVGTAACNVASYQVEAPMKKFAIKAVK